MEPSDARDKLVVVGSAWGTRTPASPNGFHSCGVAAPAWQADRYPPSPRETLRRPARRTPIVMYPIVGHAFEANCLFAKHIRHLLLGSAVYGIVRARWSRELLKETAGNLAGKLRGDSLEDLGRWPRDEIDLVRDGLVEGYER
jgi:hypothetical protein